MQQDTAVRVILFALQVFITIIVLLLSHSPWTWLAGLGDWAFGIGECSSLDSAADVHTCWTKQMIYRAEFAAFIVFMVLVIFAVSGCPPRSWYHVCPSFITVVFLALAFVILPNTLFDFFGVCAVVISSLFLILQVLVLVDAAQECNDAIFSAGISARRISINSDHLQAAKTTLVVSSVLMLLVAILGAIEIYIHFSSGWVVAVAVSVSILLLVVSITEWCEHGNLFTSSIITVYSVWLSYEVVSTEHANYAQPQFVQWIGIIVTIFTLGASIFGSGIGLGMQEPMLAEGGGDSELNVTAFAMQAGLHALAALYLASVLAPSHSDAGFISRIAALAGSLLLYGWILIAPKVLPDRF